MKILISIISALIISISSSHVYATSDTGIITGVINYCSKGGVAGMLVYIPGKSHVVITSSDGRFELSGVKRGEYSLNFLLNNKVIPFNMWVEVTANKKTKLKSIKFCDASIVSGVPIPVPVDIAPENILPEDTLPKDTLPKDKADKKVSPSAVATNSDCSGVEDGMIVIINNGSATCKGDKIVINSCKKGFSNCDKKTENGCETNLMSDDENCGNCAEACAPQEMCNLGFC